MKIGLICTWLSQTRGGIENLSYNLFKVINNSNFDVKAFSLNVPNSEKQKTNVYYAQTSKRTLPILSFFKAYKKENKKSNFDINIAMHYGMGIFALLIKFLYKTPYIVFVHGKEVAFFKNPFSKFLIKLILNNSKEVIAVSKYTKQLAENLGLKREVHIVHPGIDNELIKEISFINNYDYTEKTIKLLYIGRLIKRKGIGKTLEVVKLLIDDGYDVVLNIAGTGKYYDELVKLTKKLKIEKHVNFLGKASVEKKIDYYKNCSLFIMPSYEIKEEREVEGFGIVYLEANAFGKFVIAGNSGGISDAVIENKTGFRVDGNNLKEIKNAIIKYISMSDEEKILLSNNCKEWAKKHDWNNLFEDIKMIIKK